MFAMVRRFITRRIFLSAGLATLLAAPFAIEEDTLPAFAVEPVREIKAAFSSLKPEAPRETHFADLDIGGIGTERPAFSTIDDSTNDAETLVGGLAIVAPPLEGPVIRELPEVLRFDISPKWVTQNWSRVSTVLADTNLMGLRVPLVTGTAEDDLAGSLTYYFDRFHRVQRVSFDGYTGDERKLVALGMSYLHLRAEPTLGAGMYVARWNAAPASVLRISHVPVVRSTLPNARYEFMLEVNRPGLEYGLSARAREALHHDRGIRRW